MTVRRKLAYIPGRGFIFGEPKTPKSRRTITIPESLTKQLKLHKAKQAETKLLVGSAYQDQDLVFALPDGSPIKPDKITQSFAKFRDRHKFDVRYHDLRHTHATLMMLSHEQIKVIADRLGHSTVMLTWDTYGHVVPGQDAEAADRFDDLLKNAKKKTAG